MEKNIENKIKKKGIVGRSTIEDIQKRREIMKDILDNDSVITITYFKGKLKEAFKGQGKNGTDLAIPTNETIKKDCFEIGYVYENQQFKIKNVTDPSIKMAQEILANNIVEVSATYNQKKYIFFPFITHEIIETTSQDNTTSISSKEIHDIKLENAYGDYYNNLFNELTSVIKTNFDNVLINIILEEHNYEHTLAEIIYNALKINLSFVSVNIGSIQLSCKKIALLNVLAYIYNILPNFKTDTITIYK